MGKLYTSIGQLTLYPTRLFQTFVGSLIDSLSALIVSVNTGNKLSKTICFKLLATQGCLDIPVATPAIRGVRCGSTNFVVRVRRDRLSHIKRSDSRLRSDVSVRLLLGRNQNDPNQLMRYHCRLYSLHSAQAHTNKHNRDH